MQFPLDAKLKDGTPVQLVLAGHKDVELLRQLYRVIVAEGTSYPHDRFPDQDDFMEYWFRGKSTVAAYLRDRTRDAQMLGAFLDCLLRIGLQDLIDQLLVTRLGLFDCQTHCTLLVL
ncbi:MAG: hypothetical protein AAB093_02600 [Nitrospirota bacterium]